MTQNIDEYVNFVSGKRSISHVGIKSVNNKSFPRCTIGFKKLKVFTFTYGHIWFDFLSTGLCTEVTRQKGAFSLYMNHLKSEIMIKAPIFRDYQPAVSNSSAFLVTQMSTEQREVLFVKDPSWHTTLADSHGCVSGCWQATNDSRRGFLANTLMN